MWWIFQFTYHTSFQSFFFFAFQLFGARFTDAFEMIKKKHFYCEIMLFPPLSNWICLSSVAQYPLACSHTKPTRHNVISSSPIPHNSKKNPILVWKEIWLKTAAESPVSLQANSVKISENMHGVWQRQLRNISVITHAHKQDSQHCENTGSRICTPDDCSVSVTLQFSQATAVVLLLYKCWLLCDLHFNCSENESTLWFAVRTAAGQSQQGRHCCRSLLCASVYVYLLSVLSFPHVPC